MASNASGEAPVGRAHAAAIGRLRLFFTIVLLSILAVCLVVSWGTSDAMAHLPFLKGQIRPPNAAAERNIPVDVTPWQTAQALAALAVTQEETEYAREAERLADHEVDQAFASALRQASDVHPVLKGEALRLSRKVAQFQQIVTEDKERVEALTRAAGHAQASPKNAAAGATPATDLDVAKAQLGLDSDELADAQQDLARASGDERGRIQQELTGHETAMRKYDAQANGDGQVAVVSAKRHGTLAARITAWFDQRTRYQLLQQAIRQAKADQATLTAQHNRLEDLANGTLPAAQNSTVPTPDRAAEIAELKNRSAQRQLLSIYDDRIATEQQLATVYGKWSSQVMLQHRIVLHLLMQSIALIAFILLCAILINALIRHLLSRPELDRSRLHTLRTIFELGVQLIAIVLILLVVFGVPNQAPTVLGLTTAGLTVVLQDFILAFFGWFVLIGKNGIRKGDWVEINGVTGEVVHIGVFRTALLETGNWTDKGHPTGRRVTFINNFAITGQYFNFSTAGQWMWDEIEVSIPASVDVNAALEMVREAVDRETGKNAQLAEEEWKRVTPQNGVGQFKATPTVGLRTATFGMDVIVRYVTRASERAETRNRLYHCVIDVLQQAAAVAKAGQLGSAEPASNQTANTLAKAP